MERLSLDDPLPERDYSLGQLLQHRAGLPDYGGLAHYHQAVARNDEPWPVETLLERVNAHCSHQRPGQGFAYSNIGYWIVRTLIENYSGEPLGSALDLLVCGPLGVENVWLGETRRDLYGVEMGDVPAYHPGWVYHGLLVGPLNSAALLLQRLLSGRLLAPSTLEMMMRGYA